MPPCGWRGATADFTDPGTNTLNLSLLPGTDSLAAGRYTLIEGTTRTGQPPAAPSGSTPTPARAGAALPERTTLSWGSLVLVVLRRPARPVPGLLGR